jgi:hypothetical protein
MKPFNLKNLLLIGVVALTCVHYKNNNPYDPLYSSSNYKFKVNWSMFPDTCLLNKEYVIGCTTSVGRDTFIDFSATIPDSSFLNKMPVVKQSYDTFKVIFKKEFIGEMEFQAKQPNGTPLTDAHFLRIKNQFKPHLILASDSIATILGTKTFIVFVKDTLSSSFTLYSQRKSASTIDSSKYSSIDPDSIIQCMLKTATSDSVPDTMKVWIKNSAELTSDTFTVRVFIVPYMPSIKNLFLPDTVRYMENLRFTVKVDPNVSLFKVIVKARDGRYDISQTYQNNKNMSNDIVMNVPLSDITDTGKVHLSVSVFDVEMEKTSNPIEDSIYVDPMLPILVFDAPTLELFPNDSEKIIEVRNSKNLAEQYCWIVGERTNAHLPIDTTKDPFIKKIFSSEMKITVTVRGMNEFGFWGPPAVLDVSVTKSTYLLRINEKRFPIDIKAGDTAQFEVDIDNKEQFESKKGKYYWRIDSLDKTVKVDFGPQLSSFTRYFPDSGLFRINVIGRDSLGDSSNWIRKLVVVHRYAPICRFDRPYDTVSIPMVKTDTLRLKYYDSNIDSSGSVDSVFWNVDGDNVFETVRFRNPYYIFTNENIGAVGSRKILAYVKDNDGFLSAVDSMTLVVTSSVPYIGEHISDGNIVVGTKLSRRANFLVGSGQKPIQRYFWQMNGIPQADSTNIFTCSFDSVGTNVIIVYCVNTVHGFSPADTFLVNVYSNKKLVVTSVKPDTVWIMDDTVYSINATSLKTGVPIVRYDVSWDIDSAFRHYDTLSIIKNRYSTPGPHLLKAIAVDKDLQSSDTLFKTVWVRKAAPVCDSLFPDMATIFVKKQQTYTIWSHDSNGTIDLIKFFWKNGNLSIPDSHQLAVMKISFTHTFSLDDTGQVTFKAIVQDNDGFWSDTLRYSTRVRLGKPIIRTIAKDTVITIDKKQSFTINAFDSAGMIQSYFISFGDDTNYRTATEPRFDTTFSTAGRFLLKAYVINDRGLKSDIYRDSITVFSHNSSINRITITPKTSEGIFYITDPTTFTVTGVDTSSNIDTIKFAWKGDLQFIDNVKAVSNSATITHSFNPSDTSVTGIRIRLINAKSQSRDTLCPISIHLGRPVVDSITPRTTIVNDSTTYTIFSRDTNGTIANFIINWGDGSPLMRIASGEPIKYKYPISKSGMKNIKVAVQDDDGLFSDTASFKVNVRLCKPWVKKISSNDTMCWTDTVPSDDDTLVCPFRQGSTITTIAVVTNDSNGLVKNVYWKINGSSVASDKPIVGITTLTKDVVYKLEVWCMDDDSVLSDTLRFNVLPHTPPPPVKNDMNFEGGRLYWNGKDPVDGDQTQYKIVFKKAGADTIERSEENGCDMCTIVGFKTGFDSGHVGSLNFDWSYQVAPLLSPGFNYLYKIYMRNSRGQISRSIGIPQFSF